MPLLEIQGLADPQIRRGFESLNGYLERLAFQAYEPVTLVPFNGAVLERVVIGGTALDISGYKLPAASAAPGIVGSFSLPPLWVTGQVAVALTLCGTAASTNTFSLSYDIDSVAIGEVPVQATLGTWTVAGQAVAGAMFVSQSPGVVVDGNSKICGFKIFRATPDANAGDLYLLGYRPIFSPRKQ